MITGNKEMQIPKKPFTEWMNEGFIGLPDNMTQITKPLKLADGNTLSIQAGRYHYCSPRKNAPTPDYGYYDSFEIGFPSFVSNKLIPFAEDKSDPKGTVYAMVPKELLAKVISEHGGVVGYGEFET